MVVKPIHFRKCITCVTHWTHSSDLALYWVILVCFHVVQQMCTHVVQQGLVRKMTENGSESLVCGSHCQHCFGLVCTSPLKHWSHILTSHHNILLYAHSIMHNDIITLIDIGFECSFHWQLKSIVTVGLETTGLDDWTNWTCAPSISWKVKHAKTCCTRYNWRLPYVSEYSSSKKGIDLTPTP